MHAQPAIAYYACIGLWLAAVQVVVYDVTSFCILFITFSRILSHLLTVALAVVGAVYCIFDSLVDRILHLIRKLLNRRDNIV